METSLLKAEEAATGGFSDRDYSTFQDKVQKRTGISLVDYKSEQMRRRVGAMAERAGFPSFTAYFMAMERSPELLEGFLDKMTINVTEILRNPNRFDDLTRVILPDLIAARGRLPLSVWSAGCSYGAEAYTLALLLHELGPTAPHRIVGTDIDTQILDKARRGCFTDTDMANVSPERRAKHFTRGADGLWIAGRPLRARVEFSHHDLLAGAYTKNEYDLILCRNVVIYFTDAAKERIYRNFFLSLKPGGVLFVGGTERLSDHRAIGFELALPFFYRKPK